MDEFLFWNSVFLFIPSISLRSLSLDRLAGTARYSVSSYSLFPRAVHWHPTDLFSFLMADPAPRHLNEPMPLQNGPPPSENLLIKGLFRKPLPCILTTLTLVAFSVVRGLCCMLTGYTVKPSAWIDNQDAALMGTYAGLALSPLTAIEVMLSLGQNFAYYAKQTWLRSFVTGVKEQKDVDCAANLQVGHKQIRPSPSNKDPEFSGWLTMIPLGLVSVPLTCFFGCIVGAIAGPLTKHDTARAALVRGAIGGESSPSHADVHFVLHFLTTNSGGILGGGCFICSIWISLFLYSTQCKLPVFQSKAMPDAEAGRAFDNGTDALVQRDPMQLKNDPRSSAPLSKEGLERPRSLSSVNKNGGSSSLTQSKRKSLRRYLGQDSRASGEEGINNAREGSIASDSYAAALAASTIGRQNSSQDSGSLVLGGTTIPRRGSTTSSKGAQDEVKDAHSVASEHNDAPLESAASLKTVMV